MTELDDRVKETHQRYTKRLTREETMLISLRDELYERSWERMSEDLRKKTIPKSKGGEYISPAHAKRCWKDIPRIETLKAYERNNDINLADYLTPEEPATE